MTLVWREISSYELAVQLTEQRKGREGGQGRKGHMDADEINRRSRLVIDVAMRVHTSLGPGCLESAYEACLAYDLRAKGLSVATQVPIAAQYGIVSVDVAYRADLIVDDAIIIELKAVPKLMAVHSAQLLSYLRLGRFKLGLLINFHEGRLKNGIKRVVNGL